METNRWTIPELIARYELEPELIDVFVEGSLDREILTQAVQRSSLGPMFYEVDSVNVSAELLKKYGMSSGNKQRVIALANELSGLPAAAKVTCLVDRDLDHWFTDLVGSNRLKWSMYCSLECHFLTPESVRDIAQTTARARIERLDTFQSSLLIALRTLFSLRLVDREMNLALSWTALRKYLSREGDAMVFDNTKYVTALLHANAKRTIAPEFLERQQTWIRKLNCDIRLSARGHDYTELLAWAISEFGGQKEFASEAAIERLFVLLSRSVQTVAAELQ